MIPKLFFALLYMLALSSESLLGLGDSMPSVTLEMNSEAEVKYYKVVNNLVSAEREIILSEIRSECTPPSVQTIPVPVNNLNNSPAFTINDNQPWPIAGTLTLTWERASQHAPQPGAPPIKTVP